MSDKVWYKSTPFYVAIVSVTLTGIVKLLTEAFTSIKILDLVIAGVKWVWHAILAFLTFPVPVYWIIIGIGVLVGVVYIIAKSSKETPQQEQQRLPAFYQYRKDVLKKWTWTWDYEVTNRGHKIVNLTPHCMSCGFPLKYYKSHYGDISADCPKCPPNHHPVYDRQLEDILDIEIMIQHKVNTNSFPGAPTFENA